MSVYVAVWEVEHHSPAVQAWLLCRLQRRPMTFDPEAVLMQSGLEAASVAAFLHESMHAFINEQGAEGASVALEYLSSAGKPPGVIAHMRTRPVSSVMGCVWGEVHT